MKLKQVKVCAKLYGTGGCHNQVNCIITENPGFVYRTQHFSWGKTLVTLCELSWNVTVQMQVSIGIHNIGNGSVSNLPFSKSVF